jgi:putative pyruvate formate lyase activating enzyme
MRPIFDRPRAAVHRRHGYTRAVPRLDPPALHARAAAAADALRACVLCPWRCGVDRTRGALGYCRLDAELRVFHHYLSMSEELELTPTYEILFAGCSHRCRFCSVGPEVRRPLDAPRATLEDVVAGYRAARARGLKTLSFVGGEPTTSLASALAIVAALEPDVPIVWNTNLFLSDEAIALLDGVVSVVVGDVHFGNDTCARRVGAVSPYLGAIGHALDRLAPRADLIVRLLVLPGHVDCCALPAVDWLAARGLPLRVRVLGNYTPPSHPRLGVLAAFPARDDLARVEAAVDARGLARLEA